MSRACLGIGTNVGNRYENIEKAINYIKEFEKTSVIKLSKLYETKPWGYVEQDNFLNMCIEIDTLLKPNELLNACQEVEEKLKRKRLIRWGPRSIDIDILIYDDIISKDENLIIPHPRITQRAFVLIPLLDLNEDLIIEGKHLSDWIKIVDTEDIKEYTLDE